MNFWVWDYHSNRVLFFISANSLLLCYPCFFLFPTNCGRYFEEISVHLYFCRCKESHRGCFCALKSAGLFGLKEMQISFLRNTRYVNASMRSIWGIFIFVRIPHTGGFIYMSKTQITSKAATIFVRAKLEAGLSCQ